MTREFEHNVRGEARVVTVRDSLVTVEVSDIHIRKNEVGFICVGDERLMAEVLRIQGTTADMQVFEETDGVRVGDKVELTGEMLSVTLGPGLLSQVFDGLQNPLEVIAGKHGFFLPRGVDFFPLDQSKKWLFTPSVSVGDKLEACQAIGSVPEGRFNHKIMVPFDLTGTVEITHIQEGNFTVEEPIASIKTFKGDERELALAQRWPVRRPVPEKMYKNRVAKREYPYEPLTTTTRIIDVFFPIARG